jgi:formate hydrogenlyase subunit 6/NADH:ubiquinone oxidoreductase subunit I
MKGYGKFTPSLLAMLITKPNTVRYPTVRPQGEEYYRGALKYHAELCTGCTLCQRQCPAGAIEIVKVGEKQFKAILYLDRCIFCGQCVDSCRFKALENTNEFELAKISREELKQEI